MMLRDVVRYGLALSLAAAGVLICALVAFQGRHPVETKLPNPVPLALPDVPQPVPDSGQYAVLSERPLFVAGRHPFEAAAKPEQPVTAEASSPPAFTLLGIIIGKTKKIAMIRREAEAKTSLLHEGESVDGWLVNEIRSDAIVLLSGSEQHIVALPKKSQSTQGVPVENMNGAPPAGE